MIVNVVDSMIAPPRQSGGGTVNVRWHVGSQFRASLPPNIGLGTIQLLRIIAPHRNLTLLTDLLHSALPSLRPYLARGGWIEIYGSKGANTIGGALRSDTMNTIGGSLRRDGLNTIGGALRSDNTIGGTLRRDGLNTIGGAFRGDTMNTIGGSLLRDNQNTIGGTLRSDGMNTIGGALAPDLSLAVRGAQCLLIQP
jgi:hypothetical protein